MIRPIVEWLCESVCPNSSRNYEFGSGGPLTSSIFISVSYSDTVYPDLVI